MHTPVEHEVWRQRVEEIRQEAAVARLEKSARADRGGRYRLMGDTKWELERYAGSLKKRQTTMGLAPCQRERMNDER